MESFPHINVNINEKLVEKDLKDMRWYLGTPYKPEKDAKWKNKKSPDQMARAF